MDKARCNNCGKILFPDNLIWQVRLIDACGFETYSPSCCKECAEQSQTKCMRIHSQRYENVKNQSFQIMKLEKFGE